MSPAAEYFLNSLLCKNPLYRLGAKGVTEIKQHPFFRFVDWDKLAKREIPAPFKPIIR